MKANDIRKKIIDIGREYGECHIGGSFSCVEILIALYDNILSKDDIFILGKGHAYHALYIILKEKGYNPKLSGHPDIQPEEGIVCTSGSLGNGLPIALGFAFAKKIKNESGRVYILIGDGECQEGTTWESLLLASQYYLSNLTIIVDSNKLQALGNINDICSIYPLKDKFIAFNADTTVIDGHNIENLADNLKKCNGYSPIVIIANTIKGKGVSFMENNIIWHTRMLNEDEYKQAMKELK